jgi:hypothetical protein
MNKRLYAREVITNIIRFMAMYFGKCFLNEKEMEQMANEIPEELREEVLSCVFASVVCQKAYDCADTPEEMRDIANKLTEHYLKED